MGEFTRRRSVIALGASALAVLTAAASLARPASSLRSGRVVAACGTERWTIKTLQDRPHLVPPTRTTVHFLVSRPAPASLPDTRLPFERHIFTVEARVVLVRAEDDSDFHVVLVAGPDHMIAESPLAACAPRATPLRHRQMIVARSHLALCRRAKVTGVAFFDYEHGQTGVAPNAIELHPILAFRCLQS